MTNITNLPYPTLDGKVAVLPVWPFANNQVIGTVVAIGDNQPHPSQLTLWDNVIYLKGTGIEIEINGKEVIAIREDELIAKISNNFINENDDYNVVRIGLIYINRRE